jgi:hypothetical protein
VPVSSTRRVMGLKKLRDFLVERGQPWFERYKRWQLRACGQELRKESHQVFRARYVAGERVACRGV